MTPEPGSRKVHWPRWARLILLVAIIACMALAYWKWRDELTIDQLARHQQEFRDSLQRDPLFVFVAAFALYVAITSTFVGSATAVTLLYGWLFGLIAGIVLVSFASTAGATLTFLASRYLFRDAIERRFTAQVRRVDEAFRKNGAAYLISLRLIPGIPFFLLNAFMGLTPIRIRTYWWASQLGMLPATAIFVYAGSSVPDLETVRVQGLWSVLNPRFLIALALLAIFPLIVAWLRRKSGFAQEGRGESEKRED